MKQIPDLILRRLKELETTEPFVALLDVAINDIADTHIRLARNTRTITFGGVDYVPAAFDMQVLGVTKREGIPQFDLAISDVEERLRPSLYATNYFRGATLTIAIVMPDALAVYYQDLITEYSILKARPQAEWVYLTIGGPDLLRKRFPCGRFFADLCEYRFGTDPRCPYVPMAVDAVGHAAAGRVTVTAAGHAFETDDQVTLAGIVGITPSLTGNYVVEKHDANSFHLDSTDGANYAGAYTGGGTAGFTICERNLDACRKRAATLHFWGCVGLRNRVARLA
jgi:hypothetical protein